MHTQWKSLARPGSSNCQTPLFQLAPCSTPAVSSFHSHRSTFTFRNAASDNSPCTDASVETCSFRISESEEARRCLEDQAQRHQAEIDALVAKHRQQLEDTERYFYKHKRCYYELLQQLRIEVFQLKTELQFTQQPKLQSGFIQ